ncbi:S-adenosyl-L-methionine-dependent methyltransferases superfamily protein isoform X2 [Wolffia australiana]
MAVHGHDGDADQVFDVVIDKGGLDALMEPKLGAKLGRKFLKEVKRILKVGGKYICLSLAELHVLNLLLSEFRYGWTTKIHILRDKSKRQSKFQTYMVVAVKEGTSETIPIHPSFDLRTVDCSTDQNQLLVEAINHENKIRTGISSGSDVTYYWEDLTTEAKANFKGLNPGRRSRLILGKEDISSFIYSAVLFDAKQTADAFAYRCGIFIVPKNRAHEWLFFSEEGQWMVVESSKAARLVMVFLDSSHCAASIDAIQEDLSPLVKDLAPNDNADEAPIPFMMASDGVKERTVVKKVTSTATGPIIVEDVILENADVDSKQKELIYRRLVFERSFGLVQSEALLTRDLGKIEKKTSSASSRNKKKGGPRKVGEPPRSVNGSGSNLRVDHGFLASSYHSGIVSGLFLAASSLKDAASQGKLVKTVIVGLGAGLLPMYLHKCMPFLDIEVVELDPAVLELARTYFDFLESDKLKVHVADGLEFIQRKHTIEDPMSIVIIDADASDVSSGLTCPPPDFLEKPFLISVRDFIGDRGLFIVNLVSRSKPIRQIIVSRLKSVFGRLHTLELEEDVNEVLFAMPVGSVESEKDFPAARFEDLQKFIQLERGEAIVDFAGKIRPLL